MHARKSTRSQAQPRLVATTTMDQKIIQLVSSSNFIAWHRSFIDLAKDKDVWDLLHKEFKPIVTEPDMDEAKCQPQTVLTSTMGNTTGVGGCELRSLGITPTSSDDDSSIATGPSICLLAPTTILRSLSVLPSADLIIRPLLDSNTTTRSGRGVKRRSKLLVH